MKKILISVFAFLICFSAFTEVKFGYDALGLAKYCKQYLAAPTLPAVSVLMNTFGDPLSCIQEKIKRGGITDVQVDLIDATCWRNRVCPPGVPRPDNLVEIRKRAEKVYELAQANPNIDFQISPALEHDIKDANVVRQMCEAAKKGCPICTCINSPFTGARPPEIKLELHGNKAKAYSISNDGASIFDSNSIEYRTGGRRFVFGWFPELNLRYTGEKTFTPPLERTCIPPVSLFRQTYLLLVNSESKPNKAPVICKKVRELKERELLKTNAESYCNNNPRGNKPLFITKLKGSRNSKLSIIDKSGKEIGCFRYYGSYTEPGYHRWYVGDCSGQTPVKLFNDAKGEWAYIKNRDECILFNTIRRLGYYRKGE